MKTLLLLCFRANYRVRRGKTDQKRSYDQITIYSVLSLPLEAGQELRLLR